MNAVEKAAEVIEAGARRYTNGWVSGGVRELNVTIDSFAKLLSRHLAEAGQLVTDEMRAVINAAVEFGRRYDEGLNDDGFDDLMEAVDAYLAARGDQS